MTYNKHNTVLLSSNFRGVPDGVNSRAHVIFRSRLRARGYSVFGFLDYISGFENVITDTQNRPYVRPIDKPEI